MISPRPTLLPVLLSLPRSLLLPLPRSLSLSRSLPLLVALAVVLTSSCAGTLRVGAADLDSQSAPNGPPDRPSPAADDGRGDLNSFFDFDLPSPPHGRWLRPMDLGDRPLVVLRIASWSANCRRLLPLWQRQLERAIRAGEINVVLIAEEQQWERAVWLCQQSGIDWPLLHDALPQHPMVDYPSVSVVDRHGHVLQSRLTLTQAASRSWGQPPAAAVIASPAPDRWADQALSSLADAFRQQRQQSAPLAELQPLADHLLRRCFFAAPTETPEILAPLTTYYREALFSTQEAAWAFRLGVAHRLWFDQQRQLGSIQAEQWQESVNFLQWANRAAPPGNSGSPHPESTPAGAARGTATGRWEAWLQPYRPLVDRPTAAYAPAAGAATPLLYSETTAQPADWRPSADFLNERPADFAAATAVPWTSVRTQSVWVLGTEDPAAAGQWARLFLHVQLKRGDWDLTQATHLDWQWPSPSSAEPRPQWLPAEVQASDTPANARARTPANAGARTPANAGARAAANAGIESEDRSTCATAVWLEADVWLPVPVPPVAALSAGDSPLPPARNATLYFYGQDPSTGHRVPRRLDFFLPPPTQAKLDW